MTMTTKNLHQRLAAAMGKVDYIQKEKKQGMRYSIVSHDSVTAKVRPALLAEGIIYHIVHLQYEQIGNRTHCLLTMRFVNIDSPDDCIDVMSFGYGIDDQDKGAGKAMSYAVKYALLKTLGLETGDDPDENQDAQFNNKMLTETLEVAISLCVSASDLSDVAGQIKTNAEHLGKAEMAMLRQKYAAKQEELKNVS